MYDYLPNECLTNILVRLPVKSLLRFRRVSKRWHSLISSAAFISDHLDHAHQKATSGQFLLFRHYSSVEYCDEDDHGCRTYITTDAKECFALHKDDGSFPHNPTLKLRPPHKFLAGYFRIVGSLNGILCMVANSECFFWNPSLNKTVKTTFQTGFPSWGVPVKHVLGFGCDHITKDHKLVRLLYSKEQDHHVVPPLVEIFTLSTTKSWREVTSPGPMYILMQSKSTPQAFVSGSFHWVAHIPRGQGSPCNVIMAFDMSNEVFYEISLPGCLASKQYLNMTVVLMNGSLALVPDNVVCVDSCYSCSVWIMKEYGVVESWTKLYDIGEDVNRVVTVKNSGELILIRSWGELFSNNPYTQEFRFLHFGGYVGEYNKPSYKHESYFVDTHMERLVLVNGHTDEDMKKDKCRNLFRWWLCQLCFSLYHIFLLCLEFLCALSIIRLCFYQEKGSLLLFSSQFNRAIFVFKCSVWLPGYTSKVRMSDYLPQEDLAEILIRVPVKSLLRFRCVPKKWHYLISNPAFITHHLYHAHEKTRCGHHSSIYSFPALVFFHVL